MNNDSSSSAAAANLPTPSAAPNDDSTESIAHLTDDGEDIAQRKLQAVTQKKNELLAHLLENLDSIIYMELAVLYYMEYVTPLPLTHFQSAQICAHPFW